MCVCYVCFIKYRYYVSKYSSAMISFGLSLDSYPSHRRSIGAHSSVDQGDSDSNGHGMCQDISFIARIVVSQEVDDR